MVLLKFCFFPCHFAMLPPHFSQKKYDDLNEVLIKSFKALQNGLHKSRSSFTGLLRTLSNICDRAFSWKAKWDKVFKSGISKFCLSRPYPFNFFKGYLAQNLLSPLLNTLSQILLYYFHKKIEL